MENHKRIAGGDGECLLPPELLEHIQSLMNRKEAARSTILSKSWYNFWSKRPILDFDQRDFDHVGGSCFYREMTYKTMDDFYLHIEKFKLWMEPIHCHQPLAKESMVKAMKLEASELKLELWTPLPSLALPNENELGSETIVRLSVSDCTINFWKNGKVTRSKLRLLSSGVIIMNYYMISRYPLLKKLKFSGRLEYEFHKLESLTLEKLRVLDTLFFPDLFSMFPCLRNLKLQNINVRKIIRICSQSLESISVVEYNKAVTMQFDVPNLQKFHFAGCALSSLGFKTTRSSREWESDISIVCYQASASWLFSLRKLLTNLSLSKVCLRINLRSPSNYIHDYTTTTATNEHIPGVEYLSFMHLPPNAGLLDGLLMISRPKFCPVSGYIGMLELLCKKFLFVDEASENMYMHGLEEVRLECFEKSLGEWQRLDLPFETLLEASADLQKAFRFRLRWGTENC